MKVLTVKEASAETGIPASTLYRLISQRRIEHVRVNGRRYIRPAAIRQFIAQQTVVSESFVIPPLGDQPLLP